MNKFVAGVIRSDTEKQHTYFTKEFEEPCYPTLPELIDYLERLANSPKVRIDTFPTRLIPVGIYVDDETGECVGRYPLEENCSGAELATIQKFAKDEKSYLETMGVMVDSKQYEVPLNRPEHAHVVELYVQSTIQLEPTEDPLIVLKANHYASIYEVKLLDIRTGHIPPLLKILKNLT